MALLYIRHLTFRYKAPYLWNRLPNNMKNAASSYILSSSTHILLGLVFLVVRVLVNHSTTAS